MYTIDNKLASQGELAQNAVENTMIAIRDAVVGTMGPNGKLAVIANGSAVKVTKDGVTVARSIQFSDPFQEKIARVITEAALKTDQECGDGTTTTVMFLGGLYSLLTQFPSFIEQRFIEQVVGRIVDELKLNAIQVTLDSPLLYRLALTSANQDTALAKLVTDIYRSSEGRYPEVELKEGISLEDKVVRSKGLLINMRFSNPGFSQYGNGADTILDSYVPVVVDNRLQVYPDIAKTLGNLVMHYPDKTILVICRNADHDVVNATLSINNLLTQKDKEGRFILMQTNAGGSVGSLLMQDIAVILGTSVTTDLKQLDDRLDLPTSDIPLQVGGTRSLLQDLTDEVKTRVNERVAFIEQELSEYEGADRFSVRARFNERRIRDLKGELVTILVGGETNSDIKERVDRFEDVVKAVKSALVHGVLPGGGSSLINAGGKVLGEVRREWDATDDDDYSFPHSATRILSGLDDFCYAPFKHLMNFEDTGAGLPTGDNVVLTDLATGREGTAEELGIYDTAYASITALTGGFKTAKILANTDSILLGDKLSAVSLPNK